MVAVELGVGMVAVAAEFGVDGVVVMTNFGVDAMDSVPWCEVRKKTTIWRLGARFCSPEPSGSCLD